MKGELVSVIVAAYNHEPFIAEALQSLCDQTYENLELVVVDDGSSDATFARIEAMRTALEARFCRVEVHTQPNAGPARTISRCLALARAELVYMLDSDDVAVPHAIERLLPLLNGPGVALAVGDNDYIDSAGSPVELESSGRKFSTFVAFHTRDRQDFFLDRDFGSYPSLIAGNYLPNGWLFRKKDFESAGGYDPALALDDWPLLLRLTKGYRIALAAEILARYRIHDGNMSTLQSERLFVDTLRILLGERSYCEEHGYEAEWRGHADRILGGLTLDRFREAGLSVLQSVPDASPAPAKRPELPPPAGSRGQRIHLYALCWNDARILPYFFRHYDPFVQRYVIYDDGSTDGSLEILRAHPRVELRPFPRSHPASFVLSELDHYDNSWKESRSEADWVFVVDVDEHVEHADLGIYLQSCARLGVTVLPALGFEMVTDSFPAPEGRLADDCRRGAPSSYMSKLCVFSPDAIREIRYSPGGHKAEPTGHVVLPPRDELLLLHFKHLGFPYTASRYEELQARLGSTDRESDWGPRHWGASPGELQQVFEKLRSESVDVVEPAEDLFASFASLRWWDGALPRLEDRRQLEVLQAQLHHLGDAVSRLERDRDRLADQLRWREQELAFVRNERDAILASSSWRIAAPMRTLLEGVGRLSRRPFEYSLELPVEASMVRGPVEVRGWAFHRGSPIARIELELPGQEIVFATCSMERPDVARAFPRDAVGQPGFAATLEAPANGPARLSIRLVCLDGSEVVFEREFVEAAVA
jgi:glycosyltransferase involved in cell wall biosynthesis